MSRILQRIAGRLGPAVLLPLLALAAGCSSSGTISGKVTYLTRPLTGGTILFTSTEGKGTESALIGEDGTYTIPRMRAGPVKIAVETKSAQPTDGGMAGGPPKGMMPPKGAIPEGAKSGVYGGTGKKRTAEAIPLHYADPETSGLTYTVTGGAQTKDIDLK